MNGVLNVAGAAIGVALYTLLLAMVWRARRSSMERHLARDPLPLLTAVLGVAWNVCAFAGFELTAGQRASPWVTAAGFVALGFLPAVVVHSVVRDERGRAAPRAALPLLGIAYGASAVAAVLHVVAAARGLPVPSRLALRLLTVVFIGMLAPLAVTSRRQPGARRALWAVALAAFAVSALHLSQLNEAASPWPMELVGHHASIPLAVAILYQDYPFALADLFLKRALTLVSVASIAGVALWLTGVAGAHPQFTALQFALLTCLWTACAASYPFVARASTWFVDAVVLARPDYADVERRFALRLQQMDDAASVLEDLCATAADALTASNVSWAEEAARRGVPALTTLVETEGSHAADVLVPASEAPGYRVHVAGLRGGRRLLSGDTAMLSVIAVHAARRIDAIRLTQERYAVKMREREIAALATDAELRALRAQLNPHFLFNALTTIGYLIETAPQRAMDTLLRLTTILRGVLRSEGEFAPLSREIALVESYLAIEHARFEQRLHVRIDVPPECLDVCVPALLLQPLVENAVKHGIAPSAAGGEVVVAATLVGKGSGRKLHLSVTDTAAGGRRRRARPWPRGVGLASVERRLAVHYGRGAELRVHMDVRATRVEVVMPAEAVEADQPPVAGTVA